MTSQPEFIVVHETPGEHDIEPMQTVEHLAGAMATAMTAQDLDGAIIYIGRRHDFRNRVSI